MIGVGQWRTGPSGRLGRVMVGGLLWLALSGGVAAADDLSATYERGVKLYQQQRFAEAIPQFEKVVRLAEQIRGPEDPRLAVDLNNLGEAYRRAGRLPEAERTLERAIRLDHKLGGETPALATSLNNLALVYRAEGRLQEAMPLHDRAITILRDSLGPQHPDVARALNNKAVTAIMSGQTGDAAKTADQALQIARASLPARDPTIRLISQTLERAKTTPPSTPALAPAPVPPLIVPTPGRLPPPPSAMAALPAPLAMPPKSAPLAPLPPAPERVQEAPAEGPSEQGLLPPPPRPEARSAAIRPEAAQTPASGAFVLHLGSVRTVAEAGAEWRRLRGRFPVLASLEPLRPERVEVAGKGTFYRVLAGPARERDQVSALCSTISAAGGTCDVRRQ